MWWNVGPHLRRRMAVERGETAGVGRKCHTYFQGANSATEEFKEILLRKYGTLTRAWRMELDPDSNGLIDAREFAAAMSRVGFVGNCRSLWYNLDNDQSGSISLSEIDAGAANALEKFRSRCVLTFGCMDKAWAKCLDVNNSGFLTVQELLVSAKELGYDDDLEVEDLFDLLRMSPGAYLVPSHEVLFLQKWEERKQESIRRAWRLKPKWVNKDPFMFGKVKVFPSFSKTASVQPVDAMPAPTTCTLLDVAATKLEANYADVVAVDKERVWDDFKVYLVKTYGSLPKAFDIMDSNGNGELSCEEWIHVVSRTLRYCRPCEAMRLFDGAASEPDRIKFEDLGIERHEWILYRHDKNLARQEYEKKQRALRPPPVGLGLRGKLATATHYRRTKVPGKKPAEAFWTPLPKGWGSPPDFDDLESANNSMCRSLKSKLR